MNRFQCGVRTRLRGSVWSKSSTWQQGNELHSPNRTLQIDSDFDLRYSQASRRPGLGTGDIKPDSLKQ
jgi:hypothetical protein